MLPAPAHSGVMAESAQARPAWQDRALPLLRGFLTPDARMADEAACVASVLLAIVLAHAIGAQMVSWAAFTAFVLMKGDVAETVLRGGLRLVGTALGAGLAL